MQDRLGFAGRQVVITGAASGMGAAAAQLLLELATEVHALDVAPMKLPVRQALAVDLRDRRSIDAAVARLPERIDAHFNRAGVPHPPFSAFDTVMIDFVGLRHLTDALIPRIRTVSGTCSAQRGGGGRVGMTETRAPGRDGRGR